MFLQTNLPEFEGPEKIVIRRYSDFEWLHDRLAERYKGVFIPPLPEKNAVGKILNYDFCINFFSFNLLRTGNLWIAVVAIMHLFCLLIYFYSFPSEKFRFSKEFIELRRQALDLFVNRIASHPELKQSDVLRTFLQADEEVKHFDADEQTVAPFLVHLFGFLLRIDSKLCWIGSSRNWYWYLISLLVCFHKLMVLEI